MERCWVYRKALTFEKKLPAYICTQVFVNVFTRVRLNLFGIFAGSPAVPIYLHCVLMKQLHKNAVPRKSFTKRMPGLFRGRHCKKYIINRVDIVFCHLRHDHRNKSNNSVPFPPPTPTNPQGAVKLPLIKAILSLERKEDEHDSTGYYTY